MSVRSDKWFIKNFNQGVLYDVRDVRGDKTVIGPYQLNGSYLHELNGVTVSQIAQAIFGTQEYAKTSMFPNSHFEENQNRQLLALNHFLRQLHTDNPPKTVRMHSNEFSISENSPKGVIEPFHGESVKTMIYGGRETKIPSYGLSSYGYDIRLGRSVKVFTTLQEFSPVINVINFDTDCSGSEYKDTDEFILEPGNFALGVSMEYVRVPEDHIVICMAKSTLARTGLQLCVTPLEPGWEGYVTLEMFNPTHLPIVIPTGIGAMQMHFLEGDEPCLTSYKTRGGKYQNQPAEPVLPRV
jgi:dCTP deaminase